MSLRFFLAAALTGAVALLPVSRARGQGSIEGELAAVAGYDGNPALARDPGERLFPGGGPMAVRELDRTATVGLDGHLLGRYGGATWGAARLAFDGQQMTIGERRGELAFGLLGAHDGERGFASLAWSTGRYAASFGADDATWTRGRLHLGVFAGDHFELGLVSALGGRFYDAGGQRDRNAGVGLLLRALAGPVVAFAGAEVDRRTSTQAVAERTELRADAGADLLLPGFVATLRWTTWIRWFDMSERDGHEHLATLEARVRLGGPLWAIGRASVGFARADTMGLHYERATATVGLLVRFDHPALPPRVARPQEEGPVRVEGRTVRFRVVVPGATEVSVIGTHNGWDPAAGRLAPVGDGVFEGSAEAPPGRHRYHLLVDGEPRVPPGATHTVADDFGGEDALFEVATED